MSIEKIVRPYQTRDISPPRVVVNASEQQSDDPVALTFGNSGSLKTMNGSETEDITFYAVKRMRETTTTPT